MLKLSPSPTDPRFKPVGWPRLDRSNSLARGLVGAWIFNEGGGLVAVDLTDTNHGTLDDPTDRGVDIRGRNIGPFATNDGVQLGSIPSSNPLSLNGKTSFTLAFAGVFRTGVTFQRIMDKSNGASGVNGWSCFTEGTELVFTVNGTSPAPHMQNVFADGERFSLAWVQSGLSSSTLYKAGTQFDTSTDTLNAFPATTTNAEIGNRPTNSVPWSGEFSYMYLYDRDLSAREAKSLDEDPYQILVRKPRLLFKPSGAAPTGRVMSSLAASGGLAYKGGIAGTGGGLAG